MGFQGAKEMRQAYMEARKVDPYEIVRKMANVPYDHAKIISLGIAYGEGEDKLARDLGVNKAKAREIIDKVNEGAPFIKKMADACRNRANDKGVIITLLGRRQRFEFWEPPWNCSERDRTPRRLEDANRVWQGKWRLSRAFTHKALNRLIQGSAADMTKAAMLQIYRELKRVPLLQVHDELDFSVDTEFSAQQIQYRMENCVSTTVPIIADLYMGDHWK
jgi:DNA polymerase I-like protein with 3'-5' exonuclease and polymerase domains